MEAAPVLTPRWFPLKQHPEQQKLRVSQARFPVVPAGRRAGKSELAKRRLIMAALSPYQRFEDARYFAAAPTRAQAKRIFWDDLRRLSPRHLVDEVSRSELWIRFINGATIHVFGLNTPERIEGVGWDGGVIDEIADCPAGTFEVNVRPTLSDRAGWCWLIGVPAGRGWFYDQYTYARSGQDSEWAAFHWVSADILPAEEIESAKRSLDERTFQQEYEGSFLNLGNRVYYNFEHDLNCAKLEYNPQRPLLFFLDFNVSPGVAAIGQSGFHPFKNNPATLILDEVWIEYDSNTQRVCDELGRRWSHHQGSVIVYGDATGGAKTTSSIAGSDWDLAKRVLRKHFGSRIHFDIPDANPKVRKRVDAVNSRTCSALGLRSLIIDPIKASHSVKDFEGVGWLPGSNGEIDKKKDKKLTHLSDAIGYGIHRMYPPPGDEQKTTVGSFSL